MLHMDTSPETYNLCPKYRNSRYIDNIYLNTHLHLSLLQRKVQAGDLSIGNLLGHCLGGDCAVEGVSLDEDTLPGAPAVSLEDVDGLDRVDGVAARVHGLDCLSSVHYHLGEEICITVLLLLRKKLLVRGNTDIRTHY